MMTGNRIRPERRRTGVRATVVGATALVTLLTAGCGGSSGSSNASSGGATAGAAASTSPGADPLAAAKADVASFTNAVTQYPAIPPLAGVKALKGKTVWYVPIGSVPIVTAFGVGITAALNEAGIQTHICDGKFVPTSMATCLNEAATQGAAGVIGGYIDYELVRSAYDNLVAHHVPVLIAGEAPSGGKTSSSQLAFYDETKLGNRAQQLDMEAVMADSSGKAKILYVGVTDSATTRANAAAAKSFIQANCPGCSFTEIDYNTSGLTKVPSQVSAALISNPTTTYVVNELDSGSPATISGIQSAGFINKVKLASASGNLDALQRVQTGALQVVDIGLSPYFSGWRYADGILRMLVGQAPVVVDGVLRVFNKDNVSGLTLTPDAYDTNTWYGPDTYKQTFMSAWGL